MTFRCSICDNSIAFTVHRKSSVCCPSWKIFSVSPLARLWENQNYQNFIQLLFLINLLFVYASQPNFTTSGCQVWKWLHGENGMSWSELVKWVVTKSETQQTIRPGHCKQPVSHPDPKSRTQISHGQCKTEWDLGTRLPDPLREGPFYFWGVWGRGVVANFVLLSIVFLPLGCARIFCCNFKLSPNFFFIGFQSSYLLIKYHQKWAFHEVCLYKYGTENDTCSRTAFSPGWYKLHLESI